MTPVAEKENTFVYDASLEDQPADPARENPTPGTVSAVFCDLVPLGFSIQEPFEKGGKSKEVFKVEFYFQIEEQNKKGYRFTPRRRMNLSLNDKAVFRKFYEAIAGRSATADEQSGKVPVTPKTLFALLGTPVLLELVTSPDGKYTNVNSVLPLPKGMKPLEIEGYVRRKDRA